MSKERLTDLNSDLEALDRALSQAADFDSDSQRFARDYRVHMESRLVTADEASTQILAPKKKKSARIFSIASFAAAAAVFVFVAVGALLFRASDAGALLHSEGLVSAPAHESKIKSGDRLETQDGYFVAMLDSRATVMLNSDSSMIVEQPNEISLAEGEIWVHVEPNSGDFRVNTPNSSVVEVIGTSFVVKINESGDTTIETFSGVVSFGDPNSSINVLPGESAIYRKSGGLTSRKSTNAGEPAWATNLIARYHQATINAYFPSALPIGSQGGTDD